MIMAQEREFLKAESQLKELVNYVRGASQQGERIDQVERGIFQRLLAVGHTLLSAFVAAQGDGDRGETIEHGERTLRRLPEKHTRRYLSIFGELQIERCVYGTRESQKIEHVPLDERLSLPAGDFSYVFEDWSQRLCVKESFGEGSESLETLLGLQIGVRPLEHMNRAMADGVADFRNTQPAPPAEEEGSILVVTADAKGVPMRRPLEERTSGRKRRTKGEKANKKQMAYVGAVYTIEPFVRSADAVLDELARRVRGPERPVPAHKRVWAEMTRVWEGEETNGRLLLFANLAQEIDRRDPAQQKPLVCLMDGEKALWEMVDELLIGELGATVVGILDLFHVMERLWGVAHCFHREGSSEAEEFVTKRLRMLLEGRVGRVIGGFRQMLTKHALTGSRRKTVQDAIRYYENNRQHMRYDEYLAAGYPIGSGVAEGACRHLVKDRLERTGMRWTVEGAQAMLDLRAMHINGDWDDFVEHRIQSEQSRLYGQEAA